MSWDIFTRLLRDVDKAELVHLQGWGEPLLHPDIWRMARAVREQGGTVSMTTNGVLLDEAAVRQICKIGFAFIGVSLAGASADTHDSLRAGSRFGQICENIARLSAAESHPDIHIIMQMMQPNIDELPALVDLAAELGADMVIAPNLDYEPIAGMESLRAFGRMRNPHLENIIRQAEKTGKKLGIEVRTYPLEPDNSSPVCSDNPLNNVVVNVQGEISPCVYLSMDVEGEIPRVFWGKESRNSRFIYGRVEDGLQCVIDSVQAQQFRGAFSRRIEYARLDAAKAMALLTLPGIRNVRNILAASAGRASTSGSLAMPDPPVQCVGCYKLQGI